MKFRKASTYDDVRQIAHLLYHSNLPVHRYWKGNEMNFASFLQSWFYAKDFLYNYKNSYIATEDQDQYPLALIVGLESAPNFNYTVFDDEVSEFVIKHYIKNIMLDDEVSEFVIKHYIKNIMTLREFLPQDELLITNFCVDSALRDDDIGCDLLNNYIWRMQQRGYRKFRVDCDLSDAKTLQKYEKIGFRIIGESIGFTSTGTTDARLANLQFTI